MTVVFVSRPPARAKTKRWLGYAAAAAARATGFSTIGRLISAESPIG
jgi:hypothetical protein